MSNKDTDENTVPAEDFAHLARLAATADREEVRVFIARLVRRYRQSNPQLSAELNSSLRSIKNAPGRTIAPISAPGEPDLALLRVFPSTTEITKPVLEDGIEDVLDVMINERHQADRLREAGLQPISSAVFVGAPGVGKTHAARWMAYRLDLPLFSLDLTAVMSSLLGRSGMNLRTVLDYAKAVPSVLFLDEIDSIGKSRADETDIGELKRLVTILLQELDEWPSTSLLLAATNHPELVDRALWRRFDLVVNFPMPTDSLARQAFADFLGPQSFEFADSVEAFLATSPDASFSDIRQAAMSMRKGALLGQTPALRSLLRSAPAVPAALSKGERIEVAMKLVRAGTHSQHEIAKLTGLSRDTVRKYSKQEGRGDGD